MSNLTKILTINNKINNINRHSNQIYKDRIDYFKHYMTKSSESTLEENFNIPNSLIIGKNININK
jgi:hypothetical protein